MVAKLHECKNGKLGYTEDNRPVSVFRHFDWNGKASYGIYLDTSELIYNSDLEIIAGDALPRDFK